MVAALLAAAFVLYAVLKPLQVCDNMLADSKVVQVCARPALEGLALAFIPAVLLLLPDVSELSFLSFAVKRTVEEARATAEEAQEAAKDAKATAVEARESTATVGETLLPAAREKVDVEAATPEGLELPADNDALIERLSTLWEDHLEPFERLARRRRSASWPVLWAHIAASGERSRPREALDVSDALLIKKLPSGLDAAAISEIVAWAERFRESLGYVELTHTAVTATARNVTTAELQDALKVAEGLRRELPQAATRNN